MLEHSFPREHRQQSNTVQVSLDQGGLKPTFTSLARPLLDTLRPEPLSDSSLNSLKALQSWRLKMIPDELNKSGNISVLNENHFQGLIKSAGENSRCATLCVTTPKVALLTDGPLDRRAEIWSRMLCLVFTGSAHSSA